jgi:meso-butanediol dehydrogenase / (S,S)-butanediol dehydrogenase / diacetyl reductase
MTGGGRSQRVLVRGARKGKSMGRKLEGKVALITGGGTGIGAATARRFAEAGAGVVVTGRRAEPIEAVAREVGGIAVTGDAADEKCCGEAVQAALEGYGALDILVANAGVECFGSATDLDVQQWRDTMRINLDSVLLSARAAIPAMRERGGGSIVVLGSVASLFAGPRFASYVTSKTALIGMTRSLAIDYGPEGIRVNAVCPSFTRNEMGDRAPQVLADTKEISLDEAVAHATRFYPLRRAAAPAEIASCIEFLASEDASFVTGAVLTADGGASAVDLGTIEFFT